MGTKISSGHLDFFPNFDNNFLTNQPKCFTVICNHRSATYYYAGSIQKGCTFTSKLCTDYDKGKQTITRFNSYIEIHMSYFIKKKKVELLMVAI